MRFFFDFWFFLILKEHQPLLGQADSLFTSQSKKISCIQHMSMTNIQHFWRNVHIKITTFLLYSICLRRISNILWSRVYPKNSNFSSIQHMSTKNIKKMTVNLKKNNFSFIHHRATTNIKHLMYVRALRKSYKLSWKLVKCFLRN